MRVVDLGTRFEINLSLPETERLLLAIELVFIKEENDPGSVDVGIWKTCETLHTKLDEYLNS